MSGKDTNIKLPNLPMYVIVNIDDKTKCRDIADLDWRVIQKLTDIAKWISGEMNAMAGFGASEELFRCSNNGTLYALKNADFFVLNLKFGNTPGVTESFGLFQKRMNSLHHELIEYIKSYRHNKKANKIIYYPNPNSVGGESHRRLLVGYAKKWTNTFETIEKRMNIQVPYFEKEDMNELSVISYLDNFFCMETYEPQVEDLFWDFPSALSQISKYFNTVLLEHGK